MLLVVLSGGAFEPWVSRLGHGMGPSRVVREVGGSRGVGEACSIELAHGGIMPSICAAMLKVGLSHGVGLGRGRVGGRAEGVSALGRVDGSIQIEAMPAMQMHGGER
eukprot:scaffold208872_cov19-Tisochrysis_lutea.AAC.1